MRSSKVRSFAKLIAFLLLAVAAAACNGSSSSTLIVIPTAAPTAAPTAIPTPTPTATPSPTPTPPPASFSLTPGQMVALGRNDYGMVTLPSGKVLIAGGTDINGNVLATAEIYDPATGNFTATSGSMPDARRNFTATLLNDGRVLIAGGMDPKDIDLNTACLYDPGSDSFSPTTSPMNVARELHQATLLNDGTVLISGGFTNPHGGLALPVASAEVFDPASNSFRSVGSMADTRAQHTSTLLGNGDVLVAGGVNDKLDQLASAELYDPSTKSFTPTGSLASARSGAVAIALNDGRVLVAGGGNNATGAIKSAELYSVTAGTFSATANDMPEPHFNPAIAPLPGGKVLIAGGSAGSGIFFLLNNQAATTVFDPSTNVFTPAAPLNLTRASIEAAVLADDSIFIPGGANFQGTSLASGEIFPPSAADNPRKIRIHAARNQRRDAFGTGRSAGDNSPRWQNPDHRWNRRFGRDAEQCGVVRSRHRSPYPDSAHDGRALRPHHDHAQ